MIGGGLETGTGHVISTSCLPRTNERLTGGEIRGGGGLIETNDAADERRH